MADDTIKQLQEQRVELSGKIKELAERQDSWQAEDRANWETVNAEYDAVVEKIDAIEERNAVLARTEQIAQRDDQVTSFRRSSSRDHRASQEGLVSSEQRALAFTGWMRSVNGLTVNAIQEQAASECGLNLKATKIDVGMRSLARLEGWGVWDSRGKPIWDEFDRYVAEQRDLGTGTPASGGYLIPEGFVYSLERTLLAYGGPRRVAQILSTPSGNPLPWPTVNDTTNTGELLAEEGDIGASVDPTFGQVAFGAYKFSSKPILVSAELMDDSAFDMASLIGSLLGERIGRSQAAYFTTGTGTAQPEGVVTGSTLGITAASNATIAADELIQLQDSLDPAYETGVATGWMMNQATRTAARLLKDTTNQYLWQPGLQMGVPDMLLSRPITVCQEMPDIAASAKPVLYGDFTKFVIRDAAAVRFYQLTELYRAQDQTGFIAFRRSDSRMLQGEAIKHLVMAV